MMAKYRRITIEWSYPVEINSILRKESTNDIGIYYISRQFGEQESILYIGKTIYSFSDRLGKHKKTWLSTYRGKKFVRLGRIVSPVGISQEELNGLINDAEQTIIFFLNNTSGYKTIANVISTKSAHFEKPLKIKNTGYRGQLPKELYIAEITEDMLINC